MPHKLYVVHGSHPCLAVERALAVKGLPYKTSEYLPPSHAPLQKLRFGARTVPGLRFEDGEKVIGSRAIFRALDRRVPEPPLYPSAAVEEADRWGDEVLQDIPRRVLWGALSRAPRAVPGYQEGSSLPALPAPAVRALAPVVTFLERRLNGVTDEAVRADLAALPGHLDRVDGWIAEGVLGGDPPNAADLQIATSLRLLMTVADVRPLIAGRPAGELALRLFPDHQGEVPAGTLPAAWLGSAAAA